MRQVSMPVRWTIATALVLASAGCPSAGPALHSGSAGDGVSVGVTNATEKTICHLRVSRCDLDPPTSFDLLGEAGELAPGSEATVVIPLGCWNVKAQDCEGNFVTGLAGVAVQDSGMVLRLTP